MPEQKKHIDDFFREKMGDHTEAPPSFVWKTLEQKLDSTSTPATIVSYYKWLRYALVLSVLVVVFFTGRKLMSTSDSKQLANEQLAANTATQNDMKATSGNAVAGDAATTTSVANNAKKGDNEQTTMQANGIQATTSQANGMQAAAPQANATQLTNTGGQNIQKQDDQKLAINNKNTSGGNRANAQSQMAATSVNNNHIASANNAGATATATQVSQAGKSAVTATAANSNKAAGKKAVILAANQSNAVTKHAAKGNVNAPTAAILAANDHSDAKAKHPANKPAGKAVILAANGNAAGKRSRSAKAEVISSRINKSNLQAFAGKAKKEEYAQNSFQNNGAATKKNEAVDRINTGTAVPNSEVAADISKEGGNKTGAANKSNNNNAAGKGGDNTALAAAEEIKARAAANNANTAKTSQAPVAANTATAMAKTNTNTPQDTKPAAAGTNTNPPQQKLSTVDFVNGLAARDAPAKKLHRRPELETGIKLGYELGFRQYAADKYIVAPYVQYNMGRFGIAVQPALKIAQNTHTGSLGDNKNYYDVTAQPFYTLQTDTIDPNNNMRTKTYSYVETHDSIVVGHHIDTKSFTEIEVPVLLKYKATKNLSVYGGLLIDYTNTVVQIKEDKHVYSKSDNYVYSHTFPASGFEPVIPEAGTVFNYTGIAYVSYTNAGFENASSMKLRTGYMLGVGYTIHEKFQLDVSLQQNLSNMNYVPNDKVRGLYTQPYVRITAGYRLFKSK